MKMTSRNNSPVEALQKAISRIPISQKHYLELCALPEWDRLRERIVELESLLESDEEVQQLEEKLRYARDDISRLEEIISGLW